MRISVPVEATRSARNDLYAVPFGSLDSLWGLKLKVSIICDAVSQVRIIHELKPFPGGDLLCGKKETLHRDIPPGEALERFRIAASSMRNILTTGIFSSLPSTYSLTTPRRRERATLSGRTTL